MGSVYSLADDENSMKRNNYDWRRSSHAKSGADDRVR